MWLKGLNRIDEATVHFFNAQALNAQGCLVTGDIPIGKIVHHMAITNQAVADFSIGCIKRCAKFLFAEIGTVKNAKRQLSH
ncbi:hypothetical protein N9L57_01095 [Alphaproteobacteria bacterium]|nr:hypothetical protein [Alphaproteobacteria bacterium]